MATKEIFEKEYDEELEDILDEEESEGEEMVDPTPILSLDTEIEKTISSFIVWASVIKWLMIIAGVLMFIINIANNIAVVGIIMLIIFIIYGLLFSIFLKWFGYVLKCLQDIKNK